VLQKVQHLYGLGSGPSQFEESELDPDINRPDPQHCIKLTVFSYSTLIGFMPL
jgi:hypothetical protein